MSRPKSRMFTVFCTMFWIRPSDGEPAVRTGVPSLKMIVGATKHDPRPPALGRLLMKCTAPAHSDTPSTNRPLVHGRLMTECNTLAILPSLSTTVTWFEPGYGAALTAL